jgi:hypothetical protein
MALLPGGHLLVAKEKDAIATLVAMTLSQGHQPPRNRSRSLSFWGRLRYRTYRHPLVTFGIGPPFSGKPRGGIVQA